MKIEIALGFLLLTGSICSCDQSLNKNNSHNTTIKNKIRSTDSNLNAHRNNVHTNNAHTNLRKIIKKNIPKCLFLLENRKKFQDKEIMECYHSRIFVNIRYTTLIANLIAKKGHAIPQKTLNKIIKYIAEDSSIPDDQKLLTIKNLIKSGASTKDISLNYVIYNNTDFACKSVMQILKNNKALYQRTPPPKPLQYDLNYLSDTDDGRRLCPEAILLLVSYNPKLRNIQGDVDTFGLTPLQIYLVDQKQSNWRLDVAKRLMTKENINMTSGLKTPLEILLDFGKSTPWDLKVIRYAMKLGADITPIKDIILKRADLKPLRAYLKKKGSK